jgi:hypothetical protein
MILNTDSVSVLAMRAPGPSCQAFLATHSTEMYSKEHRAGSMASLTEAPSGEDRSMIIHHLPGGMVF